MDGIKFLIRQRIEPRHEKKALRTVRRNNLSVRMPGPLARPHVKFFG